MATATRKQLRRRVGDVLGDFKLYTATQAGTTTTFVDEDRLAVSDNHLVGRQAYLAAGTAANLGLTRRVAASTQGAASVTFGVALPAATAIGDEMELWREEWGVGVAEVHRAINHAILAAGDLALSPAQNTAAAFDRDAPSVAIPAGWAFLGYPEWQDEQDLWHPVPRAGWRYDRYGRAVELLGRARDLADNRQVRLFGYTAASELASDDAATAVDAEWLAYQCAADLALRSANSARGYAERERMGAFWQGRADTLRPKNQIRPSGPFVRLA